MASKMLAWGVNYPPWALLGLKEITPIANFARSDVLIMTLKNSHSLIKKIRLALASKNFRSLCSLAFAPMSSLSIFSPDVP